MVKTQFWTGNNAKKKGVETTQKIQFLNEANVSRGRRKRTKTLRRKKIFWRGNSWAAAAWRDHKYPTRATRFDRWSYVVVVAVLLFLLFLEWHIFLGKNGTRCRVVMLSTSSRGANSLSSLDFGAGKKRTWRARKRWLAKRQQILFDWQDCQETWEAFEIDLVFSFCCSMHPPSLLLSYNCHTHGGGTGWDRHKESSYKPTKSEISSFFVDIHSFILYTDITLRLRLLAFSWNVNESMKSQMNENVVVRNLLLNRNKHVGLQLLFFK